MSERLEYSIIIPYFNDDLSEVLDAIDESYKSCFTSANVSLNVVCVNNAGKEFVPIKKYSFELSMINETENINSPYSARNRGLESSDSDWYIFLDATCFPASEWLRSINEFKNNNIYAANIEFYHKGKRTIGDIYDSIVNINNQKKIEHSGVATTACLAVSKETVNNVGLFKEGVRSGGDILWTSRATSLGFNIVFLSDWKVRKASRDTKNLLKKQFRVAAGWFNIWKVNGVLMSNLTKRLLLFFLPPNPFFLLRQSKMRNIKLSAYDKYRVFVFGWLLRIVSMVGIVYGIFKK
ncbi:hypothetical protein BZG00_10560 [Salinivibrio kushneri]|uniref:Glycosyltransferase 2-like domain-containing protein n=1 Tax=Salinivibrio kushneri TaxID=1908198 RepID=A0AB36JXB2_9GAMM|nr:glycosyltransferase family A protein [Salinivibrio kushneri]OOE39322.1 hypothetical protein BZG00_10560 [Salinivibrio kushneri]QCP02446.1 glycosyltransferase family 2 protein [Salinivibrio kushneri]